MTTSIPIGNKEEQLPQAQLMQNGFAQNKHSNQNKHICKFAYRNTNSIEAYITLGKTSWLEVLCLS